MTVFIQEQHGIGRITVWIAYDVDAMIAQINREFEGFNPQFTIFHDLDKFKEHLKSMDTSIDECDSELGLDEGDVCFVVTDTADGEDYMYESYPSIETCRDAEIEYWVGIMEENHNDQGVIIHYSVETARAYYKDESVTGFHLMDILITVEEEDLPF